MKRRKFLQTTGAAIAGAMAAPYILPSGRLFAATGARKANHVVFCLFAGGVRNLESVQKAEGNLMPSLLSGSESISPVISGSLDALPASPLTNPLQTYGTLFKNFRYSSGPTGHYNGHTVAMTGRYTTTDLNIKENPEYPTIFEYYRKHSAPSPAALNAWWVSNMLGPYPALNYSNHPNYGANFGANFIAPTFLYTPDGNSILGNPKIYTAAKETANGKMRNYLDQAFQKQFTDGDAGVTNLPSDATSLQAYIQSTLQQGASGAFSNPWGVGAAMNNDMYNVFYAEEILKLFKPEMLVVNLFGVDICHSDFSQYCNNLRKADFAVAHLWKTIQSTPGLANDTIMIIAPEHGRNYNPNTISDANGKYALDHTAPASGGDQMAREIFCMVVGPPSVVKQNQVIDTVSGESTEVVSAMANILGFDSDIPGGYIPGFTGSGISQAFL